MKITMLEANARTPLTKTYFYDEEGILQKQPYPHISKFTSHQYDVLSLKDIYDLLTGVLKQKRNFCLLKGNVIHPLNNESRRGSHDPNALTFWLLLDIDGDMSTDDIDVLLARLGLSGYAYIVQRSASAGVTDQPGLRTHIYILFTTPVSPSLVKHALIQLNLTIPELNDQLQLTATGRGLRYILDVTTCQNDKLIYIQPAICKKGVKRNIRGPAVKYVCRKGDKLTVDFHKWCPEVNIIAIRARRTARIAELRAELGLPNHKPRTKLVANTEVVTNPAEAVVTGILENPDFIRLNLNGGETWAYWHPINNPDVIYSFKDEEPCLASALVPEYYNEKLAELARVGVEPVYKEDQDLHYLAFSDAKSDSYYYGTYSNTEQRLDLAATQKRVLIADFWVQNDIEAGDFIPQWRYEFEPQNDILFDPENCFVNKYQPTEFMRISLKLKQRKAPAIPKNINTLIHHVFNNDEEIIEHFLNWLAHIVQTRQRTETAWLLQGIPGTGKGLLFNYVLTPIFGHEYTSNRQLKQFTQEFQSGTPHSFLTMVDEADVDNMTKRDVDDAIATLKHQITEQRVLFADKWIRSHMVVNYANYIIASNRIMSLVIEDQDRRFNIAERQEKRLPNGGDIKKTLPGELQQFANYLMLRKADETLAHTAIWNEAKTALHTQHYTSIGEIASAFKNRDAEFFITELPAERRHINDPFELERLARYEALLLQIMSSKPDGSMKMTREQINDLFLYLEPTVPKKNKFTSFLRKECGQFIEPIRVGERTVRGIQTDWQISKEAVSAWNAYIAASPEAFKMHIVK